MDPEADFIACNNIFVGIARKKEIAVENQGGGMELLDTGGRDLVDCGIPSAITQAEAHPRPS